MSSEFHCDLLPLVNVTLLSYCGRPPKYLTVVMFLKAMGTKKKKVSDLYMFLWFHSNHKSTDLPALLWDDT